MKNFKKLLFAAAFILSVSQTSHGQVSFSHALGASYYISPEAAAQGFMYSPRLNFMELGDELTLSIGTHLGLGLSFNSREGASSFAFDLPIMAEINFGHAANPETSSSFGGFAGLGFGISKFGSDDGFGGGYNDAAGLVINAGLRAIIREMPVGLRVSYLLNTKEGYDNVLSIGVFYTLGDF